MRRPTALVIGTGMAGCTVAYLLRRHGFDVTVVEGAEAPGAGVRTRWYGGHPYTFGPRVFFSADEEVVAQLTSLISVRHFYTRTWTYVEADRQLYHYPIVEADLPRMQDYPEIGAQLKERHGQVPSTRDFESYWLDAIGPSLYSKFVDRYSKKMWGIESNRALVADFNWVNKGTPIRKSDTRLYGDQFQGYPDRPDGFNSYFDRCLEGCTTIFSCQARTLDPETRVVQTSHGPLTGDVIVNTGHVDALFGYAYGRLQYCGRKFLKVVLPVEHAFPEDVTWIHYAGDEPFTRITEFKKITAHRAPDTLIGIELPSTDGREYPVQSEVELVRFEKYKGLFPNNFFSIGRKGSFKYKGITDAIRDAIDTFRKIV